MNDACRLTVDLEALAANHAALILAARGSQVAPVVKADAYGLGLAPVALRLWAEGARSFFVARMAEGEALRGVLGAARPATIYVFDGCLAGAAARLVESELTPVINSLEQAREWGAKRPSALHIDTGLNRLGVTADEAEALSNSHTPLRIQLVLSHLACASDPAHPMNTRQLEAFEVARALFPQAGASLASTAGIFLGEAYHHQLVRPGIGLYGGGPFETTHPAIANVATLEAPILQVRTLRAGESVGYGAAWIAQRTTTVAIIAAGYADGVLRALGGGGYGWLAGQAWPFVGRISMDLIALDVTDCRDVRVGALVQLLGEAARLDDVARTANTASYEILTRLAPRATRVFKGAS